MQTFNEDDYVYYDEKLESKWNDIKEIRKTVTSALEIKRNEKIIGSSLQAQVTIYLDKNILSNIENIDLSELCIVSSSQVKNVEDKTATAITFEDSRVHVDTHVALGTKCERCWTIKEEAEKNKLSLCDRCDDVWNSINH